MSRATLASLPLTFSLMTGLAHAADLAPVKDAGPYVPSPQSVVSDMLRYANVGPNDFVIDLGSGDGRIVRTAAKVFGARGFGVDIKENLVRQANEAARKEGVAERAKFYQQDLFKTDLSQATVVTMYLLPDTVVLLKDKFLAELKPGTRIISHDYPLTGWEPVDTKEFELDEKVPISGVKTTILWLYVVPAKVEGRWGVELPPAVSRRAATLELKQSVTSVHGWMHVDGEELPLEAVMLRGEQLSFRLVGRKGEFSARVRGGAMEGEVQLGRSRLPWRAVLAKAAAG
ncbi:MAG TPA: methyltransferase domain-containing protein [Burkholderiales bacterium]|nr:methyltransferase domain-containing protein [Burkholderiales bacterium]